MVKRDLILPEIKEVRIFDMYYDKFGKDLKSIVFGNGKTSPKLWGVEL